MVEMSDILPNGDFKIILYVLIHSAVRKKVAIPRLCASLRSFSSVGWMWSMRLSVRVIA